MKKSFLLILLLLVLSVGAKAQFCMSANLSYSSSGYEFDKGRFLRFDKELPQGMSFEVSPRLGYVIQDAFVLGVDLHYGYSNYDYTDGFYNSTDYVWEESEIVNKKINSYGAAFFLRYKIYQWGNLSLHAELTVGLTVDAGIRELTQYSSNVWHDTIITSRKFRETTFLMRVVPVFNYDFGNHFSMDAYMNFAALTYRNLVRDRYYEKSNITEGAAVEGSVLIKDFDIGINALTTSLITLGFSYTF